MAVLSQEGKKIYLECHLYAESRTQARQLKMQMQMYSGCVGKGALNHAEIRTGNLSQAALVRNVLPIA